MRRKKLEVVNEAGENVKSPLPSKDEEWEFHNFTKIHMFGLISTLLTIRNPKRFAFIKDLGSFVLRWCKENNIQYPQD